MRLALKMDREGNFEEVDLDSGNSLDILQAAVAADEDHKYIEPVYLGETVAGATMYVNEEGLYAFEESDLNPYASQFQAQEYGRGYIRGPVIFVGPADDEGETTSLSPEHIAYIQQSVAAFKAYGI